MNTSISDISAAFGFSRKYIEYRKSSVRVVSRPLISVARLVPPHPRTKTRHREREIDTR